MQASLIDYLILLFILSIAFYMFSNTRLRVTSNSYDENGAEFPYISRVDYTSDISGRYLLDGETVYLNKEKDYYIKLSFNKELIISDNTEIRILFNNNTYIEKKVAGKKGDFIVVKGNNELHYEEELKITGIQVVEGHIKDEYDHELNPRLKDEVIKKEQSLFVLNNMPMVTASSVKSFYTNNLASIVIDTNEELVDSYCISESENCSKDTFRKYETNIVQYTFDTANNQKELCVRVKDKAGNLSECSKVEFNYYPFPKFDFEVEEGNITNSDTLNINVKLEKNEYLKLKEYCLYVENGDCNKTKISENIKESRVLDGNEGIKTIAFVLYDDLGNEFEYFHKIIVDKTKPELSYSISNNNIVSTHKDVVINFSDNKELSEENQYEYYLSNSMIVLDGGQWIPFENGTAFRIRNVKDGKYYLWIKNIEDKAGNKYGSNDFFLIDSVLSFDNSKPTINIETGSEEISKSNLSKEFIITYAEIGKIKETILDSSSLVINCTNNSKYSIKIKQTLHNGWIVEVTFDKDTLVSGYFTITVLSNLIEDEAGNRNDSITSNLIKIN